jgi:hypothetical protein
VSVKTRLYLDNRFYVSKCSCILTDMYSIHYRYNHSHIKQARRLTAKMYPGIFFGKGGGYARIFFGGFNKFSSGQRAERTGIWGRQPPSQGFHSICKWVKPVFWLGCNGCIFHGTWNSAQLCQNFGISGKGVEPPNPPRYTTGWRRSRIGCWGGNLDLSGKKL